MACIKKPDKSCPASEFTPTDEQKCPSCCFRVLEPSALLERVLQAQEWRVVLQELALLLPEQVQRVVAKLES